LTCGICSNARVKKLGETFGIEKLETASMATDKEYVYRDVEIIHAAITYVWKFGQKMGLSHISRQQWAAWGLISGNNGAGKLSTTATK
jgi:hypothetical protein